MRTLLGFVLVCVFGSAVAALPGCSSDASTPTGGAGSLGSAGTSASSGGKSAAAGSSAADSSAAAGSGAAAGSSSTGTGDATKGAKVWSDQGCGTCHADNGAGNFGPNVTFSATAGIGAWTLAQFTAAVRDGKDTDGTSLCVSMSKYSATMINDAQMADLYAYLKSLPLNDTKNKGTLCP